MAHAHCRRLGFYLGQVVFLDHQNEDYPKISPDCTDHFQLPYSLHDSTLNDVKAGKALFVLALGLAVGHCQEHSHKYLGT